MSRFFKLFLLLFLVGCEEPFPKCIFADDFVGNGLSIAAHVEEGSAKFIADNGESGDGFNPDQVIRWKDTGYVTTGEAIVLRTEGMWTAWGGDIDTKGSTKSSGDGFDTNDKYQSELNRSAVPRDNICQPSFEKTADTYGCSDDKGCPYVKLGKPEDNPPPCWFTNGYAAYILLKKPTEADPNSTIDIMRYPESSMMHIWYDGSAGENIFSSSSHPIVDSNCNIVTIEKGWKVYIKILDRFYWNDAGGYGIQFLKGVRKSEARQFLEDIRKEVQTILMDGAESIFRRMTTSNEYVAFVRILLVLYIAFTGLVYIFGMVQQPFSDVLVRVLKIALILQFISPYSWEFFYNNLAVLFVNGTAQLIGLINSHSGVEFDPDAPFASFDRMLDILFSKVTWGMRMPAFIWSWPPVIVCLVLLVIIIIIFAYVITMIYACIIYLTSLIGVAVLISIMPILFLTLLFSKIPNMFETWLKQMMSFALQSILVFTLVSLFAAMIMNFYYRTFGFTTCYNKTVEFSLCLLGNGTCFKLGEIHSWTFGDAFDFYEVGPWPPDLSVKDHRVTFSRGAAVIKVPPLYEIEDYRYIDYPFFDPNPDSDSPDAEDSGYDHDIIEGKIKKDQFIVFEELFALVLITMLLWHLRLIVQRIGASIAGASPFLSVIGHHYQDFFGAQSQNGVAGFLGKKIATGIASGAHLWGNAVGKIYDLPEKAVRAVPGGANLLDSKVASVARGAFNVAEWSVGAESDLKAHYREKDAFKWIHHKQAVIGETLSNLSPDNLVKSGLSYGYNKAVGNTDRSLAGHIKTSYAQQLEKLHNNIIGYKRPGAPDHIINEEDDVNPFQRTTPVADDLADNVSGSVDRIDGAEVIGSSKSIPGDHNDGEEVISRNVDSADASSYMSQTAASGVAEGIASDVIENLADGDAIDSRVADVSASITQATASDVGEDIGYDVIDRSVHVETGETEEPVVQVDDTSLESRDIYSNAQAHSISDDYSNAVDDDHIQDTDKVHEDGEGRDVISDDTKYVSEDNESHEISLATTDTESEFSSAGDAEVNDGISSGTTETTEAWAENQESSADDRIQDTDKVHEDGEGRDVISDDTKYVSEDNESHEISLATTDTESEFSSAGDAEVTDGFVPAEIKDAWGESSGGDSAKESDSNMSGNKAEEKVAPVNTYQDHFNDASERQQQQQNQDAEPKKRKKKEDGAWGEEEDY